MTETVAGIIYSKPTVILLQETGIGTSEIAARTCYDSFDASENYCVKDYNDVVVDETYNKCPGILTEINNIQHSDLLDNLAWTYFHHSILEHANLSFLVRGTSRACYSSDTEVLTDKGWKLFSNLNKTEKFLTRNPDGSTEFQKANDYIKYNYKGNMHRYKSSTVDLLVTPNHRMMYKKAKNDTRTNIEKIYYKSSENITNSRIRMLKTINYNGKGFELDIPDYIYEKLTSNGSSVSKTISFKYTNKASMLKLLAAYISDGSVTYSKKEGKYTITISTPYREKQAQVIKWLEDIGVNAYITKNGKEVRATNRPLGSFLKSLGTSLVKHIPFDIFNLTKIEANLFIDTYLQFDGSINLKTKQGALYTSSKQLADDLFNIALIAGFSPNIHVVDNRDKQLIIKGNSTKCNSLAYQIGISFIQKQNIEPIVYIKDAKRGVPRENMPYNDYVYCVSVPNSNLFVRRVGTGNAVWCGNCLQEHARHRIQAISVRSTRYTMSSVINAFVAELAVNKTSTYPSDWFIETITSLDLFVTTDISYNNLQIADIFNKLKYQAIKMGSQAFFELATPKSAWPVLEELFAVEASSEEIYQALQAGKKKRNVADPFKHIVTDNWKVDMVVTFNLRSLKNYLTLRDSGAAYFQIRNLAQAMKEVTPKKYLDLIVKSK